MATTITPYGTTNKYETLIEAYQEDVLNWLPQFEAFTNLSSENAAAKQVWADHPVGQIGAHADPITAHTHGSAAAVSVTPTAYSGKLTFTEIEEARDSNVVANGAEKLMIGAKRTFEKLVFDALPLGITTTEVPSGDAGASVKIFSAAHTDGSSVQSNLSSAALSHSSLNDGRVALRKWKNTAGEPLELDRGPLALIVPPELGDTARRLVGSPMYAQTFTDNATGTSGATDRLTGAAAIGSAGAHSNPQFNRPFSIIESAYLTDGNNWYLFSTENTPLNLWVPTPPSTKIIQDVANRNWVVSVLFEAKVYWRAPVSGCFGAGVS